MRVRPTLALNKDNNPANYGAIFDGSKVNLKLDFVEGYYLLALS
jgi:hypothetical protein